MSHPDPLFDPDNCEEDDMNYDDYDDFYCEDLDELRGRLSEEAEQEMYEHEEDDSDWSDDYDDSMDGDHESALGSCGWGVDEYYREDFHSDDGYGYYED
jgi:hypothetical protein